MAKLPRRPDLDRLRATRASLIPVPAGQLLHRVYLRGGDHPTYWNAFRHYGPLSRFDHHLVDKTGDAFLQERGIIYAATDVPTAVAEFFQRNRRRINRIRRQPWLASFVVTREFRLLDLTGFFCVRAGASAKLASGPFGHAQNWSRGFYDVYSEVHGLYYRSSLTNEPVAAFYDRAAEESLLPAIPRLHRALADPLMHQPLVEVADEIGYGLI